MEITLNPELQARIDDEFLATRSAVEQGLNEAEKGEGFSLEEFDRMMRARHGIPR